MSRFVERLLDLIATAILLAFAYVLRETNQALAGAVVYAAIEFWLRKNAAAVDSPAHQEAVAAATNAAARVTAAAIAAAEVLRTAVEAKSAVEAAHPTLGLPSEPSEPTTPH